MKIDFKNIFDDLVMKAISTGDQKLWNHLFPHIQRCGYTIDENIIKHFALKLGKSSDED